MQDAATSLWKQLQAHLTAARACLNAGEFDEALAQVELAIAIDPQYLAARALRDRILEKRSRPEPVAAIAEERAEPVEAPPPPSGVSLGGYARFEERARQRRIEKRIDAARVALRAGQVGPARAAIDELYELAPDHAALPALDEDLALALVHSRTAPNRAPRAAAVCVFVGLLLCATLIDHDSLAFRRARGAAAAVPLPAIDVASAVLPAGPIDPPASSLFAPSDLPASATTVDFVAEPRTVDADIQVVAPPEDRAVTFAPAPAVPVSASLIGTSALPGSVAADPPPPAIAAPLPVVDRTQPMQSIFAPSDDRLVRDTLQRYRVAYEGLNAESAKAVWPGVDQPALARAFDGLESQSLTFDDCAINVDGLTATAVCRGSARYVPKEGSREPHVEARVWNFTLRKTDARWQIDTARVGR